MLKTRQNHARILIASIALVVSASTYAHADEAEMCGAMMEDHSIVPFQSWGTASSDDKQAWDSSNCNHNICLYMEQKYDVEAGKSWGTLPENLQKVWDDPKVNCNSVVQ